MYGFLSPESSLPQFFLKHLLSHVATSSEKPVMSSQSGQSCSGQALGLTEGIPSFCNTEDDPERKK